MFDNLFGYFGPIWSAAALLGVVVLLFVVAAAETVRLVAAGRPHRPCLAAVRLMRARRQLAASWALPLRLPARLPRLPSWRPGQRE